jgi:hypothetical protein
MKTYYLKLAGKRKYLSDYLEGFEEDFLVDSDVKLCLTFGRKNAKYLADKLGLIMVEAWLAEGAQRNNMALKDYEALQLCSDMLTNIYFDEHSSLSDEQITGVRNTLEQLRNLL